MAARADRRHDRGMKRLAFALLLAQQLLVLFIVPRSALCDLAEPTTLATLASALVTVVLAGSRFVVRPAWFDRAALATVLAGMPIIYAWSAVLHGNVANLAVEGVGIVVFVGLALAGVLRAGWLIGLGILVHGLAWDAWHHGHSGYIPDWYSAGCLVADLGIGMFALVHLGTAPGDRAVSRDAGLNELCGASQRRLLGHLLGHDRDRELRPVAPYRDGGGSADRALGDAERQRAMIDLALAPRDDDVANPEAGERRG